MPVEGRSNRRCGTAWRPGASAPDPQLLNCDLYKFQLEQSQIAGGSAHESWQKNKEILRMAQLAALPQEFIKKVREGRDSAREQYLAAKAICDRAKAEYEDFCVKQGDGHA